MAKRFNPLDPLGIFSEKSEKVTPAEVLSSPPGTQYRASVFGGMRRIEPPKLPAPPDPLGLFERSNPGNPERKGLPQPPDPLGILTPGIPDPQRHSSFNPLDPLGLASRKKGTIGNPIPIEFNGHLVDIKNQARETLIARGHPSQRVDMALKWAEEWLMGMARRMAPGNIALQKSIVQSGYAEIASRAESWLRGIEAAFAVGGPVR